MTTIDSKKRDLFLPKSQIDLDQFILSYKQDVPNFYEEGICEIIQVPVEGGTLKVYHNKPEIMKTKRPIVFVPGFGTTPRSWREFHYSHHGFAEYYYIETREKKSAEIKRNRKADFSILQFTKDIATTLDFLGLTGKDYVLVATCMCGGVLLMGLIEKILNPPTVVVLDPFTKWTQNRFLVKFIMPILPPIFLEVFKRILGKIIMANMKNQAQKERNMDAIEGAVPWKWRKFSLQNVNYDITNELQKIEQPVYIFHGPKDKYHPEGTFHRVAKAIPNSHFFLMKTSEHLREMLIGVIATEFAFVTKNDGIPKPLLDFEIPL